MIRWREADDVVASRHRSAARGAVDATGALDGSDWALHMQPVGAVLVEKSSLYYVRLSALATELLLELTRGRETGDLATARSILDNEPRDRAEALLAQLLDAHPLTREWSTRPPRGVALTGSRRAFLPIAITAQLTNACSLKCSFCYAASGTARPDELSSAEWVDVLEDFALRGAQSITLTGGEPSMRRDFRDIMAAASGMVDNVAVFTNGFALGERTIALMRALGNITVQISLDGDRRAHDALRGVDGSFARALDAIRRVSDAGIRTEVAMTASPRNIDDVASVARAVDTAGARYLRVGRVDDVGRGSGGAFRLTDDQVRSVERQLDEVAATSTGVEIALWSGCADVGVEISDLGYEPEFLSPGYLSWYVLSDGTVTPCQLEERAVLGNVRTHGMEDLGAPERLQAVRATARDCACIPFVQIPAATALPFRSSWESVDGL